jgi:ATP-dependent DNA helicase PIF1
MSNSKKNVRTQQPRESPAKKTDGGKSRPSRKLPDTVKVSKEGAADKISLSQSQKTALMAIMKRQPVFFTGPAGSGKSFIIRILQEVLHKARKSDKISLTAPTGVAAVNIGGLTIHSWSGMGIAKESVEVLSGRVSSSKEAKKRWINTEILVIDEISMLSAEMFDKLSEVGKRVRNDFSRPFGGIQLVICGDFYQLPPVGLGSSCRFCFESKAWGELFGGRLDGMIALDKVFRQKDDSTFLGMLQQLREGILHETTVQTLQQKVVDFNMAKQAELREEEELRLNPFSSRPKEDSTKIKPTKLFPTNRDVDSYNYTELQRLKEAQTVIFNSHDVGLEQYVKQLDQGIKAVKVLELKVGAQVDNHILVLVLYFY